MGPSDDPRSSGLWFTVDLDKGDFVGRSAITAPGAEQLKHRTAYVRLDDPEPVLVHDEAVLRDGVAVGRMLSGAYGYTLGSAVGHATLDPDADLDSGTWAVECAGWLVPATVSRRAFYDPSGSRMRG